jgi:hypothetical protein
MAWSAALQLTMSSLAFAHGAETPQALSIVASDALGPSLVRLNEGFAVRRPEGFRYLCPALWGEDSVALAQSIAGGAAVIGASSGLLLLTAEGSVERHPDPAASGHVIALASTAQRTYALRAHDGYELLEVHSEAVRVLWRDAQPWEDMAVSSGFVVLMRVAAGRLFERRLSLEGAPISEREAQVMPNTSNVRVRTSGATSYALLLSSSLQAELGRISESGWLSVRSASTIAGPIETSSGAGFAAIDGALSRFEGQLFSPLNEPARVSCLGQGFGLSYACADGGLRALDERGLGSPLFALDMLVEPDLSRVPERDRATCALQWQRFTIDLLRVGITPRSAPASTSDAGADAGSTGGESADSSDAGATQERGDAEALPVEAGALAEGGDRSADEEPAAASDATIARHDLDAEPEPEPEDPPPDARRTARSDCALGPDEQPGQSALFSLALAAWLSLRRARPRALRARSRLRR